MINRVTATNELNTILETIDSLEKRKSVVKYDYSSKGISKKLEKRFDFYWSETLYAQKKAPMPIKLEYINLDTRSYHRRKKAVLHYLPNVTACFSEKYTNICVEDLYLYLNSDSYGQAYDLMDGEQELVLAASIWIADHLQQSDSLERIMPILMDIVDFDDSYFPEVFDSVHPKAVLYGIYSIIKSRNENDKQSTSFGTFSNKEAIQRSETSHDYSFPQESAGLTPREGFDAILSLIPKESILKAVKSFESKLFELLDLYLDCCSKSTEKLFKQTDMVLAVLNNRASILKKRLNAFQVQNMGKRIPSNRTGMDLFADITQESEQDFRQKAEIKELLAKNEKLDLICHSIDMNLMFSLGCSDNITEVLSEGIDPIDQYTIDRVSGFSVDDPFEIIFALLYLIDSGSDLPWLYPLGLGLVATASNSLPWAKRKNKLTDEERDELIEPWPHTHDVLFCNDSFSNENIEFTREQECYKDTPSFSFNNALFASKYNDSFLFDSSDKAPSSIRTHKMNLSQIIFELGFGIIPRYQIPKERAFLNYDLQLSGLSSEGQELLSLFLNFLNNLKTKEQSDNAFFSYLGQEPQKDLSDEDQPQKATESTNEELVSQMKKTISELKVRIKEEHSRNGETKKSISNLERENEELKDSIAELTAYIELLKRNNSSEDSIPAPESTVLLPYNAKHRIVVFGGHESWRKAIKEKISGVRFVEASAIPNIDLILHSDIVFLQNNAIPHKSFYVIADATRKHGIPLEYFRFASAEKCAIQLAEYDLSFKN